MSEAYASPPFIGITYVAILLYDETLEITSVFVDIPREIIIK